MNSSTGSILRLVAGLMLCTVSALAAPTSGNITLTATPNPSVYGHPVTLTATLTGGGTGKVTFFDGVASLETSTVTGTTAVLTTSLLGTGEHSLRAIYIGDASHFGSTSAAAEETVNANAATGFQVSTVLSGIQLQIAGSVNANFMITGDFNGDGKTDMAFGSDQDGCLCVTIGVALGNGDGTFRTPVYSPTPTSWFNGISTHVDFQTPLMMGDFNGDGKPDLVFGLAGTFAGIYVLTGNGDGTFQAPVEVMGMGASSSSLAVGDFNGDGRTDILYPPYLLLGNGDGTFQAPVNLANLGSYFAVVTGDFNGDGEADVAAITAEYNNTVSIQLGTGAGTFQAAVSYPVGASAIGILASDINGDGKTDLAVLGSLNGIGVVSILLGNGDGTFQAAVTSTTAAPGLPTTGTTDFPSLAVADFNGDGKMDVAAIGATSLSILAGNGDGTFQAPVSYAWIAPPETLATGDFNGDGRVDLAVNYFYPELYLGASTTPNLAVTLTHSGTFQQGVTGTYTITVKNTGNAPATQPVTVIETLQAGLTVTAIGGTGWSCSTSYGGYCTRGDALTPGASYPSITVSVKVATNATSPQTNMVSVQGGEAPTASATDSAAIAINQAALQITKTHTGNFTQGQTAAVYTVTVSNGAAATSSTSGMVTVTETVPTYLALVSMAGSGWGCSAGNTCTRNDPLAAGVSYPAITVTVNVADNAVGQVTNQVSVSGGLSLPANASDPTTVMVAQGQAQTITFSALSSHKVADAPFMVTATASSGLAVSFASTTPAVCTVVGSTVTLVAPGICTITAAQPGNATYSAATPVTQSFTIFSSGALANFSELGIFRALGGSGGFWLDLNQSTYNYDSTAKFTFFGLPGDQPVAGDWDGTGVIRLGVFRQGNWYIDLNNNGVWDGVAGGDAIYSFGLPGDIAIPGDWGGTGVTKLGVFRCPPAPAFGGCTWYLDAGNKKAWDPATAEVYSYGLSGDLPVVNNWNGTGNADQIGVFRQGNWIVENVGDGIYRPSDPVYQYGLTGDLPVVGNWSQGPQRKRIGVFRNGMWILDTFGTNSWFQADTVANFGLPGDQPVVGFWTVP